MTKYLLPGIPQFTQEHTHAHTRTLNTLGWSPPSISISFKAGHELCFFFSPQKSLIKESLSKKNMFPSKGVVKSFLKSCSQQLSDKQQVKWHTSFKRHHHPARHWAHCVCLPSFCKVTWLGCPNPKRVFPFASGNQILKYVPTNLAIINNLVQRSLL